MVYLLVSRKRKRVGRYPLRGRTYIGRGPDNDVVLDDPLISRVHAQLVERDGRCTLVDAGSRNGVFVDGSRVNRALLRPGSVFQLCDFRCRLLDESGAEPEGSPIRDEEPSVAPDADTTPMPPRFVGRSKAILELLETLPRVAASQANVLITGESGAGKGVIARLVHDLSPRACGPFVVVNCAAVPSELIESEFFGHRRGAFTGAVEDRLGKFQSAEGGSLFLDEVGDLSPQAQAKILRAIEDKEVEEAGSPRPVKVDVRIISATNKDPAQAVASSQFRQDLLYRLAGVRLRVPPLRERPDDVVMLAASLLEQLVEETPGYWGSSLANETVQALTEYPWPGNVRELANVIRQALILRGGGVIRPEDLVLAGESGREAGLDWTLSLEELEKRHIAAVLERMDGNISRAARSLGIQAKTLRAKLKRHGLRS